MPVLFPHVLAMILPTLAGVGVVVALVAGVGSFLALIGAAVAGALGALALSWVIAREIGE
jgi:hypothetical protein